MRRVGTHTVPHNFGQDIGAALARKEAKLALEHLFDRIADIRIDETMHGPKNARRYDYEPNYTQRALCAVHIQFTKA